MTGADSDDGLASTRLAELLAASVTLDRLRNRGRCPGEGRGSGWLARLTSHMGGIDDGWGEVIVGLAEAVESLRAELMKAVEAGKDQPMQFSVEPIELTAQVAVTKAADGKIGWNLLGIGGSWESASTQTLTLKLAPVWKKPDGTLERDFTIASAGPAGDRNRPV